MNDQQPVPPRRRLQILLAIPDNQKTEAQWEEINELEISLAPGNRADAPDQRPRQSNPQPRHPNQPPSGNPRPGVGGVKPKKPFRKPQGQRRPPKPDEQ